METKPAKNRHRDKLAWLCLVIGFVVAAIAYWQGKVMVGRELSSQLDLRTQEATSSIERELDRYAEVLRGLQSHFLIQPDLSRRSFRQIAQSLRLDSRLPGIQSLVFTQRIAPGAAAAFEASVRREFAIDNLGYPPPVIHPRTPSGEAFVVQYRDPAKGNPFASWYDQASEPKRRAAIERARDTGKWSTSGRIRLAVAPGDTDGVIFFLPLYRGGTTPATVDERRAQFFGVVSLVIRVDEMLRDVFGTALLKDLDIEIYEMQGADVPAVGHGAHDLIFDSGDFAKSNVLHSNNTEFPLHRSREISLGGALWHLQVTALPNFINRTQSWLPLIAAVASMLLSLLIFFMMRALELSRKSSDTHAKQVEQQLARITQSIEAVLWTVELPSGKLKFISSAGISGRPVDAFYRNHYLWIRMIHPDDRKHVLALARNIAQTGRETFQYRIVRPDGTVRWVHCEAHYIPGAASGTGYIDGIDHDITEQRRLEESLRRSNRALRAIHECEEVIARTSDEQALLQGICAVVVGVGYRMAWAGVLGGDDSGHIVPVGLAGEHDGYLDSIQTLLERGETEEFGTLGEALRTCRPSVLNRLECDAERMPWRAAALQRGFNSKITLPLFHESGTIGLLNVYAAEQEGFDEEAVELLQDMAQSVTVAIQALRHLNGRRVAEAALHLRGRAIEASANAVIITSAEPPEYPVEYVNAAFEHMTGYAAEEVIGRSLRFLQADDHEQPGLEEIRALVNEKREGHGIVRNYRKDGTPFWSDVYIAPVKDETGHVSHFVAAKYDITATKKYEAELEFHVNRDALTGLANRNLLCDRLSQAIAYASRYAHPVWVVFINLDRFKLVNDTLGFEADDVLLKIIAERLCSAVRESDTVARLGGDEFVVVLPERTDETLSPAVVQRIMAAATQSFTIDSHEYFPSYSVGIAVFPSDGDDAEVLIQHAHIAMYRAKESGNNSFQFYTSAMNDRALERLHLERDLHVALKREEFVLYYQPQVELRTGHIIGMEALLRWQHPRLGLVSPTRFIGLAEETGLIVPIGNWVLRTACMQCKTWQLAGLGQLRVAVNLSVRQFVQQDLVQSIANILSEAGLEPQYLDIELTESLVMADVEQAVGILRDLKALGVHLSIDDFGTGYSSLAYLKRFPINVLKVDQSFVLDITSNPDDAAIARSVISLAHSLRLQVIAEGVETEAQMTYLRRQGCDQIQGYYFSQPVPSDAFEQILVQGKTLLLDDDQCGQRQTLLIIDDEANVASALQRLLRYDGYHILKANGAAEGFELLARHPVQVILCDQRMPAINGTEFLSKVKDMYPDTIRIVLSGYTELQSIIDAINRGAIYRFFTKPWEDDVLRDNIRQAFQHYWLLHGASSVSPGAAVRDHE